MTLLLLWDLSIQDVSQPVAASLMAYQWLKNKSPACAAAHFLTPFLASFAAAARRQWHALQRTSIVVHFSKTGPAALVSPPGSMKPIIISGAKTNIVLNIALVAHF